MTKVLVEQPLSSPGSTKYRVAKKYENITNGYAKTMLLGYNIYFKKTIQFFGPKRSLGTDCVTSGSMRGLDIV